MWWRAVADSFRRCGGHSSWSLIGTRIRQKRHVMLNLGKTRPVTQQEAPSFRFCVGIIIGRYFVLLLPNAIVHVVKEERMCSHLLALVQHLRQRQHPPSFHSSSLAAGTISSSPSLLSTYELQESWFMVLSGSFPARSRTWPTTLALDILSPRFVPPATSGQLLSFLSLAMVNLATAVRGCILLWGSSLLTHIPLPRATDLAPFQCKHPR